MFAILGKMSWFFKQEWKRYTLAITFLVALGVMEVIPPKVIGNAIDSINTGEMNSETLTKYVTGFLLLTVVIYLMTYVFVRTLFGGSFIVERILRSRLMGQLLKMTPTFYEKNRTGDLMARATNDLKAIAQTAGFGILTMIDSSVYMLTIVCTMGFTISWKLTIMSILPLPIMALAMNKYGKHIHERFTIAQDSFGGLNDYVLESVSGVRVIRSYVQEKADHAKFHAMTEDVFNKNMNVARIDSLFDPTIKLLVGISYLIGLGFGASLVFRGEITLGELVSFNVYLGMMIWPMFAVGELINVMQRGNASFDRVNDTLTYKQDVTDVEETVSVTIPETVVFKNVTFRYPTSTVNNLENVSLNLTKGQTLGIVGRTGSGKTTLIRQLLREYPLGTGDIEISNVPLQKIAIDTIQSWLGYVPQDHVLFSRTVQENILFGNKNAPDVKLQNVIDLSAFRNDISMLNEGLETLVGEKGVALSGGQKQRISIARALLVDPEILILDDALSAVDAKTEATIIENIRRERSNKTTLITTHRLSAVEHADWIVVLDDGRIVEEGTHEQLIKNNGWYSEQYIRQQVKQAEEA